MRLFRWLLAMLLTAATLLCVMPLVKAASPSYATVWKTEHSFDSLSAVAAGDLNHDNRDELVLAGRYYIERQFHIEVMTLENGAFSPRWRSPNIYEDYSSLRVGFARFQGMQGALVLTRTRAYLYTYDSTAGEYITAWETKHTLYPSGLAVTDFEMALADFDSDGSDEIVVSRVFQKGTKFPSESLVMLDWTPEGFTVLARTPDLGNIRSLAAGDVDGDGSAEVMCEVGVETHPGDLLVFKWENAQFVREHQQRMSSSAVYGMGVYTFPPENRKVLLGASSRGWVEAFAWQDGEMKTCWPAVRFAVPLTDVAAGDFDGDGVYEMAAIGYRNILALIRK